MPPTPPPSASLKVHLPGQSHSRLPLSGFIICQNEEHYLGNCIASLEQCAEIIIIDSGSTDGTASLVQSFINKGWPIRFIRETWRGYAAQKQFAMDQCTQPWCLSIDSDERLDESLKDILPQLLEHADRSDVVGYKVARRPYLIGYGYTPPHVHERRNLRLIRNGRGSFDCTRRVHEGIVPDGRVLAARTGSLLHYRPLSIDEQILKENKYSTLKAEQLVAEGCPARVFRLISNPPTYFARLYFLNGLWRCGFPGFIQAATGAIYSFLTECKIYQRNVQRISPPFDDMNLQRAEKNVA